MTLPLALLFYQKLLPGSQLLNRLQDLGYRVMTCSEVDELPGMAIKEKPMLVFADLVDRRGGVPPAIKALRGAQETAHVPVIAYAPSKEKQLQEYGRMAGATLVVNEEILMQHLEGFLDQALQIE